MDMGKTMGGRAYARLPCALARLLSALPSGGVAESVISRTASAATTDPFPSAPGLRPPVEFWIDVFTRLRQNDVLLHAAQLPRLHFEVFTSS
jgi:hypothetical protein